MASAYPLGSAARSLSGVNDVRDDVVAQRSVSPTPRRVRAKAELVLTFGSPEHGARTLIQGSQETGLLAVARGPR